MTVILDTDAGADGEAAAVQFEGVEGTGGLDVMYALAMEFGFRFRSYAAQSPTNQITPHPAAFDAPGDLIGDLDSFVEDM
ncbi:hypothetical protein BRC81_03330 [Halobacteriales archaeon QS_1_68_20]|nr:MAG: hypothetical protein BRC81_03330 [Halobacteriales archaeon QS_1_68_20]